MFELPRDVCEIDGFTVEVECIPESLFTKGELIKLYEQYYHLVTVTSDGTNPFVLEDGYWEVFIVKQKTETVVIPDDAEVGYISLHPTEIVTCISLVEKTIQNESGIWLSVDYEDDDTCYVNDAYLVYRYGSA